MKPYYERDGVTIYHGDCIELADAWADADVMVTDPPYAAMLEARIEALITAAEHFRYCQMAGESIEFRCDGCVQAVAALAQGGREK